MPPIILCFGDSNTYGFAAGGGRLPTDRIWPYLLQNHLKDTAEVRCDGACGRYLVDPRGGASMLHGAHTLRQRMKSLHPDGVILQLGTNDLLAAELGPQALATYLDELIRDVQRIQPRLALWVLLPSLISGESLQEWSGTTWGCTEAALGKLKASFKDVCLNRGVSCLETESVQKDPLDGIHLSLEGHARLAELLAAALAAHLNP